jgi:hypothetical protein
MYIAASPSYDDLDNEAAESNSGDYKTLKGKKDLGSFSEFLGFMGCRR